MIEVNQNNLESYISDFELFLGKSFIDDANNYIENNNVGIKNCTNKKVHPFYKYWNSYINDIKNTKEHNKLHISRDTVFILELLSNIKDIKNKKIFQELFTVYYNIILFILQFLKAKY